MCPLLCGLSLAIPGGLTTGPGHSRLGISGGSSRWWLRCFGRLLREPELRLSKELVPWRIGPNLGPVGSAHLSQEDRGSCFSFNGYLPTSSENDFFQQPQDPSKTVPKPLTPAEGPVFIF